MYMVVLYAVLVAGGRSQSPEQLYQKANEAYQLGKFGEAKDLYEAVHGQGYESGELMYNLGNAYYKTGNIAYAIVNYERALRLIPGDDDLINNLKVANLMITDKIEPAPRLFIWEYWDGLKAAFSLDALTWFVYAMFVVASAFLSWLVLARRFGTKRFALLGAVIFGAFCLAGAGVGVAKYADLQRVDLAVVVTEIATIKNSPDPNSTDAFVLHSGVKVQITDRVNQWVRIRLSDGKVGWMESTSAEII